MLGLLLTHKPTLGECRYVTKTEDILILSNFSAINGIIPGIFVRVAMEESGQAKSHAPKSKAGQ